MKQTILMLILVWVVSTGLLAQSSFDLLLERISSSNQELITARNMVEARKLDARTGLTPENPEVEFGYMWGQPSELGHRTDLAVTQSFDFPTAYASRSKLSKINQSQADLEYSIIRQQVFLKAWEAWVNRIYLNNIRTKLSDRIAYASVVADGFERMLETGETNRMQYNQAMMKVTALENEMNLVDREFARNHAEIMNLSSGQEIMINDTTFPVTGMLTLDSLMVHYRNSYMNQLYLSEVDKKAKEVDVVFNQKLPKLMAGYYSERILGTTLQGIKAGITIPLWENARAVKTAKANLAYAETDAALYWQRLENEIVQKYEQWIFLKDRVKELEKLILVSNDEMLLRRAMEEGEISLTEYFYESDFYFRNIIDLVEFKKEMLLLEGDLRKVYF